MKKFYFLLLLQITLMTFASFGQGFTNRQVYDFNFGDIIQRLDIVSNSSGTSTTTCTYYIQDSTTSKHFSTNGDTIYYSNFHKEYWNCTSGGSGWTSNSSQTNTFFVTNLDSIAIAQGLTHCDNFSFAFLIADTQYYFIDQSFCQDSAWFIHKKPITNESTDATFHKGLGNPDFNEGRESCHSQESCKVIYSRKSGVECGARYTFPNVGIQDIKTNTINILPNPTSTEITITLTKPVNNATIRLINLKGQTIIEKQNQTDDHFNLDISQQTQGIYFVEIRQADNVWRTKLVKQ